jgi:hypothetical protein
MGGLGGWDQWQASIMPVVDFNGDGLVDSKDLAILAENWGWSESQCDIGPFAWGDGNVDERDLAVLAEYMDVRGPVVAHSPRSRDPEVARDVILTWTPGDLAQTHDVYLGTSFDDVNKADRANPLGVLVSQGQEPNTYDPPGLLERGTTYYWRVDEVGAATTYRGFVWSFTVPEYVVVDNFERYTNKSPNRVFQTWIDGTGFSADEFFPNRVPGNGTGAVVGHDPADGDIMERTIVHTGLQSMPFGYNGLSEATRTFDQVQDWTANGLKTLVLYFYGASTNEPGGLYVKVNGTKVSYNGDPNVLATPVWTQWDIDLSSVGSLSAVQTLTIGVSSGQGKLYIDDIRLYRVAPAVP